MTKPTSEERLDSILLNTPITDTHNDFPYILRSQLHNEFQSDKDFDFLKPLGCHTDLLKLRKGKVGLQFFSCFIECKDPDPLYQDFNKPNSAVRDTMEQIDVVRRLVAVYKDLALCSDPETALNHYKSGKISIALGVEGLHQVDSSLAVLRLYHELGVRYITLTHNCDNPFATAASSVTGGLPDKGLSKFGKECILEMNRLGIMVDLAHVSLKTMHDALEVTKSPVIFSHSSCYSLTPHKRNVPDEVLLKVKANNGVVCINFFPLFIEQLESGCTIDDAVDHIVHIIETIGWDHVGFGSDFDGIPEGPQGLEDVSKYPDLIYKVMERTNATDEQVAKMIGGNVLRVWKANEEVAKSLDLPPCESNWSGRIWGFKEYLRELRELFPGSYERKKDIE